MKLGVIAAAISLCVSGQLCADNKLKNINDFSHKLVVLDFLDAVARKDRERFSRLVDPEARLAGIDKRTFRELNEPLTLENSQEMIEKCNLQDISWSTSQDIDSGKVSNRTLVSWNCGPVLGEQTMYITFQRGLVTAVNPFGPPAIVTVLRR